MDKTSTRVESASRSRGLAARLLGLLSEGAQPTAHLTRGRLWFVHALIAFIVGGHVYDIALDKENWPFSQYPMFSRVDTDRTHETLRVFGVTSGDEIPLLALEYIYPLDQCRLSTALTRMRAGESASADLRDAVHDVWARYEVRRRSGDHDGPPLEGARLYALQWHLDAHARNAQEPNAREMLLEVRPQPGNTTQAFEP